MTLAYRGVGIHAVWEIAKTIAMTLDYHFTKITSSVRLLLKSVLNVHS